MKHHVRAFSGAMHPRAAIRLPRQHGQGQCIRLHSGWASRLFSQVRPSVLAALMVSVVLAAAASVA